MQAYYLRFSLPCVVCLLFFDHTEKTYSLLGQTIKRKTQGFLFNALELENLTSNVILQILQKEFREANSYLNCYPNSNMVNCVALVWFPAHLSSRLKSPQRVLRHASITLQALSALRSPECPSYEALAVRRRRGFSVSAALHTTQHRKPF